MLAPTASATSVPESSRRVTGLLVFSIPDQSGWLVGKLTSENAAANTRAPSLSATCTIWSTPPDCAMRSPMMMTGFSACDSSRDACSSASRSRSDSMIPMAGADDVDVRLHVHGVPGERQEGRAGGGRLRLVEGPAHRCRNVRRVMYLVAPLGVLAGHLHQVARERRLAEQHPRVRITRAQDHRRATAVSVIQRADAVGQPAGDVDVSESGAPGCPGVAVCHPDGRTLLQGLDVIHLGKVLQGIHHRSLAGAGVAEDVLHALGPQHPHQGILAGHHGHRATCLVLDFKRIAVNFRWRPVERP